MATALLSLARSLIANKSISLLHLSIYYLLSKTSKKLGEKIVKGITAGEKIVSRTISNENLLVMGYVHLSQGLQRIPIIYVSNFSSLVTLAHS